MDKGYTEELRLRAKADDDCEKNKRFLDLEED